MAEVRAVLLCTRSEAATVPSGLAGKPTAWRAEPRGVRIVR
jgi:hypothetical protein